MKRVLFLVLVFIILTFAGCGTDTASTAPSECVQSFASAAVPTETPIEGAQTKAPFGSVRTGLIAERILSGAEGDEYYGSEKARSAYENLRAAYKNAGWSDADTDAVLRLKIPDNAFFNGQGIYNYYDWFLPFRLNR